MNTPLSGNAKARVIHHDDPGQPTKKLGEHQLHSDPTTAAPASAEPTVGRAFTSKVWWDTHMAISRRPMNNDDRAVLVALLSYANGPGHDRPLDDARPGVKRLMAATGLGRSTVIRKLGELVEADWLEIRKVGGGASATTYKLTIPAEVPEQDDQEQGGPAGGTGCSPGRGTLPMQSPVQSPVQSVATDKSEAQEEAKDGKGLTRTYEAFETWARAIRDGKGWDADMDLLETLTEEHGEEVSDWAVNNFTLTEARAHAILEHPKGSRYGAAVLAGTLLATAKASGCAEVINMPGRAA